MAEIVQSRDGYATLQYKLVMPDKQTLTFDPQVVTFHDAEIRDNVYGVGTALHTFETLDTNFLDSLRQVMASANPLLEFRLGFGTPKDTYWLPWQQHIITNYNSKYEGIANAAGHTIVIGSANTLTRYERANKVVARKGSIAEIVAAIAVENGLKYVIEPTDGKFLLYQSFTDDTRFVHERLLPRALNSKGRGGFYFYIRDNVLHFHTPEYQSNVRQMNYYDVFGTELSVRDASEDPRLWDNGVAGIRVVAHDSFTGQTQEIESNPANAMRLADSIYQFQSVNNGAWNVPYHLSYNPPVEVTAMAQFGYERARLKVFQCSTMLEKTIVIRHGDFLNLGITQQTSRDSTHSGFYFVVEAAHTIKKQAVSSLYTLLRGEHRGQDQSLSAQNAQQQLLPESKAPGVFPNILEIQSSEVTKGAGKQSSAKTYTVVADANTGKPTD